MVNSNPFHFSNLVPLFYLKMPKMAAKIALLYINAFTYCCDKITIVHKFVYFVSDDVAYN